MYCMLDEKVLFFLGYVKGRFIFYPILTIGEEKKKKIKKGLVIK